MKSGSAPLSDRLGRPASAVSVLRLLDDVALGGPRVEVALEPFEVGTGLTGGGLLLLLDVGLVGLR